MLSNNRRVKPMKESELVAGLRKLYSKPIPENCRISKMNPAPWNNPGKAKVTLSNLLAKRFTRFHKR